MLTARMHALATSTLLLLLIPPVAHSLLVVPSSPQCADLCGNTLSSTQGQEITCADADYASSLYGATFKACLACELSSTYVDPTTKQSDLQTGLYNLRFALSWCLFGFDNNTQLVDSPCQTRFSCGPLQASLEDDSLAINDTEYGYCTSYTKAVTSIQPCSNCLAETSLEYYLSNFVTVLNAACIQQPPPGQTISIKGNVFSSQRVNITTPTPSAGGTYNPISHGLTLDAKIGIAVGGILIILIVAGFCIIWNGRRRRRAILAAHQKATGYAEWHAAQGTPYTKPQVTAVRGGGYFDSPQSQRPLTQNWYGSPETATPGEKTFFSPYSSNYTSPVNAAEGLSSAGGWSKDRKGSVTAWDDEQGERIEMVGVEDGRWQDHKTPVLSHPGHGRKAPRGLSEEDAKAGNAL